MSVTVRPYVNGGWEVDIRVELPDGTDIRERKKAPSQSKTAAQRWAEARERVLLVEGKPKPIKKRGGARETNAAGIRTAFHRRIREGEPIETERSCREEIDSLGALDSAARRQAAAARP